jgi:hypothetical protein
MKIKTFFLYFSSIILILFGLTMILGAILKLAEGDPKYSYTSNLAMLIIVGILPASMGCILIYNTIKKNRNSEKDRLENTILKLAKENNGKLTASDVAMNTSLSVEESKNYLDSLCIKGIVELFISESGISVYKFKMIIPENEKNNAEKL